MRSLLVQLALAAATTSAFAGQIQSSVKAADLPKAKLTSLGLYLTSADAASALETDPTILFLDVRDPIEVTFVGHPTPIDAVVPLQIATLEFDANAGAYRMKPNPNFVTDVAAIAARQGLAKQHPIFVMCRSGGRSAAAAQALAGAGYTNVWNLIEGFEGDTNDEGDRSLNGWRNSGLPWTYKLTAEQAWTVPE